MRVSKTCSLRWSFSREINGCMNGDLRLLKIPYEPRLSSTEQKIPRSASQPQSLAKCFCGVRLKIAEIDKSISRLQNELEFIVYETNWNYGGALQKSLPARPRLSLKSPHVAENWAHSKPVLGDPGRH